MKTLTDKNNLSFMVLEDDAEVTMTDTEVVTPDYFLACHTVDTVNLYENVTPPEDWENGLYYYDGTSWTKNTLFQPDSLELTA